MANLGDSNNMNVTMLTEEYTPDELDDGQEDNGKGEDINSDTHDSDHSHKDEAASMEDS